VSRLRTLGATAAVLFALGGTGCAYHVVHTAPLVVQSPEMGVARIVSYPVYVLVHDEQSLWDGHQIKDNIIGLFDGEIVRWIDLGLDAGIPGRDQLPVQNGIEWVKNGYAQLPDVAPVRIVGGFFTAFAIEKSTILGGVRISGALWDPISYFGFTRVVYLSDWVQETLGEVNTGLGHLVPWEGAFVPAAVTAPVNGAVDWAQFGAVTGYVYLLRQVSIGFDDLIYGWEWCWGAGVSLFVDDGEPVNQSPSQSAPASP
jgi:hypothetical protein